MQIAVTLLLVTGIAFLKPPASSDSQAGQFRLGRLRISGNLHTRQSVIYSMIPLAEGDIFDQTKWELGLERINSSGLFNRIEKGDVILNFDHAKGLVDVELRLTERDRHRIDVSGGGGTTGGFSVGVDYTNSNLTGYGDRLTARLRAGNRELSGGASYSITTQTEAAVRLDLAAFRQRLEFVDARGVSDDRRPLFVERTTGASAGVSWPTGRASSQRLGVAYSVSSTNLTDSLALTEARALTQDGIRVSSLIGFFDRNSLDRDLDPREGERLLTALELSARAFGGSFNTIKPSLDYRRFFVVERGVEADREPRVLALGARASLIAGFGRPFSPEALTSVLGVPLFKRFFVGGAEEVRGYDVNSIAPLARIDRFLTTGGGEPVLLSSEIRPIGGDTRVILNAEYRVPLAGRLSAAAFVDLGASLNLRRLKVTLIESPSSDGAIATVVRPLDPEDGRFPSYRVSIGAELRVAIPALNFPLRLFVTANPNAQRRPPASALLAPERRFSFGFGLGRTL
jgi:outer membrane protein insertion porin family